MEHFPVISAQHLDLEVSEESSQFDSLSRNGEIQVGASRVGVTSNTPPRLDLRSNILDSPCAAALDDPHMHNKFIQALRTGNMEETCELIAQKADVNCLKAYPCAKTPLHHVVETSGNVSLIYLLLQHKAHVNTASEGGTTPLHCAIKQYTSMDLVVLQMLMCARADLAVPDETGTTPFNCAQRLLLPALHSLTESQLSRDHQLMHEITQRPTIAVHAAEAQELQCAAFGDFMGGMVAFHTESAIGLYSVNVQNVIYVKSFGTLPKGSCVRSLAVNPNKGTIAVCLDIYQTHEQRSIIRNECVVWPSGNLQQELPLKLSVPVDTPQDFTDCHCLHSCVMLSKCPGEQTIVNRLSGGQVYCWRLNPLCTQLMHEAKLVSHGGLVSTSDSCSWVVVLNMEYDRCERLDVWSLFNADATQQGPMWITSLSKRPACFAVKDHSPCTSCLLALAEEGSPQLPFPPIEVCMISME